MLSMNILKNIFLGCLSVCLSRRFSNFGLSTSDFANCQSRDHKICSNLVQLDFVLWSVWVMGVYLSNCGLGLSKVKEG